jgi:hypothetical protein
MTWSHVDKILETMDHGCQFLSLDGITNDQGVPIYYDENIDISE